MVHAFRPGVRALSIAWSLGLALLLSGAVAGAAEAAPVWKVDPLLNTTVQPGHSFVYVIEARNVGDQGTDGSQIAYRVVIPPGVAVTATEMRGSQGLLPACDISATEVLCSNEEQVSTGRAQSLRMTAFAEAGASGTAVSDVEVSGGGAALASTVAPIRIGPKLPFGIAAFDQRVTGNDGAAATAAASHPAAVTTDIDFNTVDNGVPTQNYLWPAEPVRDVFVGLPPGLVGDPNNAERCTLVDLANGGQTPQPLCASEAQVGTATVRNSGFPALEDSYGPLPLFNLVPPPNVPARFGFAFAGTVIVLDAQVRSGGDYGLTVASRGVSEGVPVAGTTTTFWGEPASPVHDFERACRGERAPGRGGPHCNSAAQPAPFLRNPTSCSSSALTTSISADSWFHPGVFAADGEPDLSDPAWKTTAVPSHEGPGYPHLQSEWGEDVGITDCEDVPFSPSFSAQPTTNTADSPSGLDVHLALPQQCWQRPAEACQSDLRDAEIRLPAGMTLNPSAASGLGSCSPSEVGLTTPVGQAPAHFTNAPANCPDAAKIGDVQIDTPLLEGPLTGAVYLAKQQQNPFGSLLAMYLVAEGSGVVIKQAGEIEVGPGGRLTTVFREAPQLPFSDLHVSLYGGPRAALRTPPACGSFAVTAKLTPWSGNAPANLGSGFEIDHCPNSGFDPKLSAGTANPVAGAYSPFALRLSREDGSQELSGLRLTLPHGLLANLKGIPYCPDSVLGSVSGALGAGSAWLQNPGCPAASQVGTLTVGAGAGPNPFWSQTGKAYWAGPYKGAPVSLAVVVPAIAGPFDLGSVVVRNRFEVNPETAEITAVSDPFPSQLHGIPLDLRDVRLNLDRPNYTLNPTSCNEMAFQGTLTGLGGAVAQRSERFQVAGCDRLGFKPKLSLRLKGKTRRGGNPALRATLTMPPGGANIAKAQVSLPHSEFLDQGHIRTICTRVQFAAGGGGGEQCPAGSIYGHAVAYSPILDYYLQGPVYLRSSDNPLPDLVAALGGQIHVDLVGRIDSHNGGIRTTFEGVPDAPVSKFVLQMQGGRKGLLQNSTNICRGTHRATALFDAQNGKIKDLAPALVAKCGGKTSGKRYRGSRG